MKILSALALLVSVFVSLAHAQTAPTIASLSDSRLLTQGDALSLSVSVNGTAPFTYVWKKAGTTITGATSSTYSISAVATTDAGSYTVTITNASGSVTSGAILVDVTAAKAPVFDGQPGNVTVTIGDTIALSAWVSGTLPFTVEWKKGSTILTTGSSTYYSKANAQLTDAGTYTIVVTNIAGTVTSAPFIVTVNALTAPSFYYGPYGGTVDEGDYFSLYAYVNNASGVTYQWYRDGVPIPDATNNAYGKSIAVASDAGSYTVVATNSAGSTTSPAAVIVVRPPSAPTNLSISSGPITVTVGESLSLYSSVSGNSPFAYQWLKDGVEIAGATNWNYYKPNVTANDTGSYSIVVTNSVGSATSSTTSVAVSTAQVPIITYHPTSITVYPGDYLSLSVSATGTGTLSYQWKKDGVNIANAISSGLWLSSSATASDAGSYSVAVTNGQGSATSQPATVTVMPALAPAISIQPAGVSLVPGENAHFFVEATGRPSPTYQWKKDNVDIVGATSYYYTRENLASSDSGSYTVVVSNSAGSVTSQAATLNVGVSTDPVIYAHPASGSLLLGEYSYHLTIQHSYRQGMTVQWYRNGAAIPGANSTTHYISNAQPADAGTYKAIVTSIDGQTSTSANGVITVDLSAARPVIIYTSGSQAVEGGGYTTISINVAPSLTEYTVAWKKNGVAVPNANSLYLNLSNFNAALAGTYMAEVTAGGNTYTSQPIVLTLLNDGVSPRITSQPAAQTRIAGQQASFYVYAVGEQPLTYQWRKGGVDIPNATSQGYYIGSLVAANAGDYSVVVTNENGSASSSVAALTVSSSSLAPPALSHQPASQTLTAGNSYLQLSVGLLTWSGTETYQWYKDGLAVAGATSSYYQDYGSIGTGTAGRYKVTVTNGAGSTTSDEAIVTVTTLSTGPTFTTQPESQSGYTGSTVTFSAVAQSSSSVTYQWRKNGTSISGATSSSLAVTNLKTSDAGSYTVVASNESGSASSAVAQLTVTASVVPVITTQPSSQVGGRGGSAGFSVTASGTPSPSYQWKKNDTAIPGATNSMLSWSSLVVGDAGNYSVVVSNSGGSVTSNTVSLTVFDQQPYAATITSQPQSRTYSPSQSVTLSVGVGGIPSPAVQWYKNGAAISGAQSTTLSLGNMSAALEGQYHAVANNVLGSATSATASITLGADTERLVNVSSRGVAGKDSNTLIAGFVISGSSKKSILLRAIGPSLVPLGVPDALPNPRLRLFKGTTPIMENDDWSAGTTTSEIVAASTRLGAHPLVAGTADAALMTSLDPGVYSAHVTTSDSSTGVVLMEVYDADELGASGAKVVNLSSRGPVGRGNDVLIVGFVINGATPKKVLIRGVGPALTPLGVAGALVDPKLQLYRGTTEIYNNDDWSAGADVNEVVAAVATTGASVLTLGSKDAAILVTLAPGVYSAHVRGVGDTTGVALVEVYDVP